MQTKIDETIETANPSIKRRCIRWLKRLAKAIVFLFSVYVVAVLIGLIPVNNNFTSTTDGIEIFVYSDAFHADIVLPVQSENINWRVRFSDGDFRSRDPNTTHVAFGWGDRRFYVETPTWADFRISTATNALFIPSTTVMHVGFRSEPVDSVDFRSVKISNQQYEDLIEYIERTFELSESGGYLKIPDAAYGASDAFFEAKGSFHCFNTCNCWIGGALRAAGIRAGWFTPMPKTVFVYLP